jgi:hypothetical protein
VTPSFAWLVVFAAMLGLGYGLRIALMPAVLIELLGVRNLGAILGVFFTASGVSAILGPPLAPIESIDEREAKRRQNERTASGARGSRPKCRIALPDEPSTEVRERRHVGAGRANADTNAIGQISLPHLPNETGQNQAASHHPRPQRGDDAGPKPIAKGACYGAGQIKDQACY